MYVQAANASCAFTRSCGTQFCFLAGGLAKAPAIMENSIATTKIAEMITKPPSRITRMNSKGPLKCLCAASVVKLVIASKLSLMSSRPSLQRRSKVILQRVHAQLSSKACLSACHRSQDLANKMESTYQTPIASGAQATTPKLVTRDTPQFNPVVASSPRAASVPHHL